MSENTWTPISERLPTQEEFDSCGGWFWVTRDDDDGQKTWRICLFRPDEMNHHDMLTAWIPDIIPEPYIPPQRKRREWHFDGEPRAYESCGIAKKPNAVVHAGPPCSSGVYAGGIHVREVLPGDPDVDAARNVIEWLESHETMLSVPQCTELERLVLGCRRRD